MPLNEHAIWTMVLTALALILFTRERIPLETTSLLVIVALTVGFTLFPFIDTNNKILQPTSFFRGFGHEALIAVCGLMIAGYSIVRTGALEPVGRALAKTWLISPLISILITLIAAAFLSAFVNNTPIVVLLIPILVNVALRTQNSPSSILMPMGLATLLGGMTTTIGTSTNLLVVSVASDLGLAPIKMFDFFVPGIIAAGAGILFLWLIAPKLLRNRTSTMQDISPRMFNASLYIPKGSFSEGKTLAELIAQTNGEMQVLKIQRKQLAFIVPLPDVSIRADDVLFLMDTPIRLKEFEQQIEATLYSKGQEVDADNPLSENEQHLAELVIDRGSPMVHRTLTEVHFSKIYNLVTLAIHRKGKILEHIPKGISGTKLRHGDVLLVQGSNENIEKVKQSGHFLVLDATIELPLTKYAPRALIIMAMIIGVAAMGILPISISALAGSLLMLLTNCLKWQDVRRALSSQVVLIVVASLALGSALVQTGATQYIAHQFVVVTEGLSGRIIFSALMLLMAILTNVVSNNAAAVIGTPVAVSIAQEIGLPVEAFVLAVLFGANMSYATPMAYQTNLLVMNAGGYTFMDFVKVGIPLTLIVWACLSLIVPALYGF